MAATTVQKLVLELQARGVNATATELEHLATSFLKVEQNSGRSANKLEVLTGRLDAVGKAEKTLANIRNAANNQLEKGIALTESHTRAIAQAEANLRRAQQTYGTNDNGERGLGRYDWINLSRQFQDIAVSIAGGQRPMTVLLQQGAQISDIFGAAAGGPTAALRDFGKAALWLATNPLTMLTAALGTLFYESIKTTTALTELGQQGEKIGVSASAIMGAREVGAASGVDNKGVDSALAGASKQFEEFKRNGGQVLDFINKFDKGFLGVADSARNAEEFISLVAREAQRLGGEQGLDLAQRLLGADQGRALIANMEKFVSAVDQAPQPIDTAAQKAAELQKQIDGAAQKASNDMLIALQSLNSPVESLKLSWYAFVDGIALAITKAGSLRAVLADVFALGPKIDSAAEGAAVGGMLKGTPLQGRLVGVGPTPFEKAKDSFFAAGPQFAPGGLPAGSSRQAYADALEKTKKSSGAGSSGKSDAEKELETYEKITKELEEQIRLNNAIGAEHKKVQAEIDKQNWIEKLGTKATQERKDAVGALADELARAKEAQDAYIKKQQEVNAYIDIGKSSMVGLGTSLADAFVRGAKASEVFLNALHSVEQKLLDKTLTTALDALFPTGKNATEGAGTGFLGSLVGGIGKLFGFANGGIMTSAGAIPLHAYATGGVASGPQMALFGEGRRPEAFVPLPDGRNIPVKMHGQQGGGNGKVTINNYAAGVDVETQRMSDGELLVIVNKMVDQKMKAQVPGIVANSQRRAM